MFQRISPQRRRRNKDEKNALWRRWSCKQLPTATSSNDQTGSVHQKKQQQQQENIQARKDPDSSTASHETIESLVEDEAEPQRPQQLKDAKHAQQTNNNRKTRSSTTSTISSSPSLHTITTNNNDVFTIHGVPVRMIDRQRKVMVVDLVPPSCCAALRRIVESHVAYAQRETWRTLYTYTHMDLPCADIPHMKSLVHTLLARVVGVLAGLYGKQALQLRPRSWKEPHVLLYRASDEHTGVGTHFDGSDFTWSLMLSQSHEYENGGTYIRCLKRTILLEQGQVLIHPGALFHAGAHITKGERQLLVCFMDGMDSKVTDTSEADADEQAAMQTSEKVYMYPRQQSNRN